VRRCTGVVEDTRRRATGALNTTGEKRSCHVGSAIILDAVKRSLPPSRFVIDGRIPRVRGSGLHHMWVRLIILLGRPADAAWVHDQSP
jgi:hypothetical protein